MVLSASFCAGLRYEGVKVSPISSVSPVGDLEDLEEITSLRKEMRR